MGLSHLPDDRPLGTRKEHHLNLSTYCSINNYEDPRCRLIIYANEAEIDAEECSKMFNIDHDICKAIELHAISTWLERILFT